MPEISRFPGIVIYMYFNDHAPPHFHVRYGEHRAKFAINEGALIEGSLPPRALGLVTEWATIYRMELLRNWTKLATEGKFEQVRRSFSRRTSHDHLGQGSQVATRVQGMDPVLRRLAGHR